MTEAEHFSAFENMGEEGVRDYLKVAPDPEVQHYAHKWLKLKDEARESKANAERKRLEDAQASRDAMVAAANRRDKIAAPTAIIAAIIAALGLVIAFLGWRYPREPVPSASASHAASSAYSKPS